MESSNTGILKADVNDKFSFIQQAYDLNQYDIVVKECCSLFEVVFKRIFSEAVVNLPYNERMSLIEHEKKIGNSTKGVQEFGLGQLVGLFRESDLMKKWAKYSGRELGLIDTLNFNSIVKLRNRLVHEAEDCSQVEADLVYNYLKNLLASFGFVNLEKAITASFEKKDVNFQDVKKDEQVNIRLMKDRGIIINEADGTRNISFKVDTINSIFEVMVNKISQINNPETANKLLWEMGYEGGKKFGISMNQKWELEEISYDMKITKWCEFDSVVGWGKFTNNLVIDPENGEIGGNITISENFLCNNRRKTDLKLCDYIKGYSTGVIEVLLNGIGISFDCMTDTCPQDNPFKKECLFSITIK